MFKDNRASSVDGHFTNDFYADLSSHVEFKSGSNPQGYLKDSYLKSNSDCKSGIWLEGNCVYEEAYGSGYVKGKNFVSFNVGDVVSWNKVGDYLKNHGPSCVYVNFTGDCNLILGDIFNRNTAFIFNSNGFNVGLVTGVGSLDIVSPASVTFIGFDFNNVKINNKGTCSFVNCSFHNNHGDDDYFFSNAGSCTLTNCNVFDNECDDYIIYNTGHLSIVDSALWGNSFDEDYGVIYNKCGTVSSLSASFSDAGYHVYNFASGNCAVVGDFVNSTSVKYDKPWASWKADLVKSAFMLGTVVLSYGAGAAMGSFLPGLTGMIAATFMDAGIGAVGGLSFGLIEGNVYHDYSNLWSNVLSFAMLGASMGQLVGVSLVV